MSEEFELLKFVCQGIERAGIPYMLTGSFAANFYAIPRMTRDIDIVIAIRPSDVDKIFHVFQNDFLISKDAISDALTHQGMFNIIHQTSLLKVDFIVRKNELYRSTEFQRRHRVQFKNIPLWIVAPEDLIISKLFWAKDSLSQIQLNDVKNLRQALKNLDEEYIHKWVQILELSHVYQKVQVNE